MSFKEFSEFWIETIIYPERKRKTYLTYRSLLKNHIYPAFGLKTITEMTVAAVTTFRNGLLTKGLSKKTANESLTLLKSILNSAVSFDKIPSNPIRQVKTFPLQEKNINFWSKDNVELFLSTNPRFKEVYIVALNTGLRIGEIFALTVEDLDFKAGLIKVSKTRLGRYVNSTKNGHNRYIPINDRTRQALSTVSEGKKPSDLLWTYCPAHFTDQIFKVQQREIPGLPLITFHDLRDTFASHFVMNGGNIYDLSKILGHCDPKLTSKVYAHLSPSYMSELTHILNF